MKELEILLAKFKLFILICKLYFIKGTIMTEDLKPNEILLNIMFTGTYLDQQNIGHEVINLFKADNGKNYIYVLPYGNIGKEHNGKIKTILLVRRCNANVLEILAKAVNLTQVAFVKNQHNITDDERSVQNEVIKEIKYGNVFISDIFSKNISKGQQDIFISFEADKVVKVRKPIYLSTAKDLGNNKNIISFISDDYKDFNFAKQSPKQYISEEKQKDLYDLLQKIIDNEENWGEETKPVNEYHLGNRDIEHNFIDIICKGYDELVYSNLFQYFFQKNIEGFKKFARDVLHIDDISNEYSVKREYKNIDIFITYDGKAIIIENKIKSGINGICKDDNTITQLSKYVDEVGAEGYKDDELNCYIFVPDYNLIDLNRYKSGEKYKVIKYSEIYKFFMDNKELYKNTEYFDEFLYALSKHIKDIDNNNEEEMYQKFMQVINSN